MLIVILLIVIICCCLSLGGAGGAGYYYTTLEGEDREESPLRSVFSWLDKDEEESAPAPSGGSAPAPTGGAPAPSGGVPAPSGAPSPTGGSTPDTTGVLNTNPPNTLSNVSATYREMSYSVTNPSLESDLPLSNMEIVDRTTILILSKENEDVEIPLTVTQRNSSQVVATNSFFGSEIELVITNGTNGLLGTYTVSIPSDYGGGSVTVMLNSGVPPAPSGSSPAPSGGSVPAPASSGSYVYTGCFKDSENRVLPLNAPSSTTIEECYNFAKAAGSTHFGLQYPAGSTTHAQCFHGANDGQAQGPANAGDCVQGRDGMLGGAWVNAVYRITEAGQVSPVDCMQSAWDACSAPCGGGTQSRTILVSPTNGGADCGPSERSCNTQACDGNEVYETPVQLCSPWETVNCKHAGPEMTCQEYYDCWNNTSGERPNRNVPCGGEEWYNKCGWGSGN